MKNDILTSLTRLSDLELVARLKSLVARERDATAHLVAHLAEMDTRDVYLREGYDSLFAYCRDVLGLSEGEGYNRIEVARAARRFPVILEMLETGDLTLTAVRLLAPHLTAANHREVLNSAHSRKKEDILKIVARLAPRPDLPTSVRKVAATPPPAPPLPSSDASVPPVPVASASEAVAARADVAPLSPDRYKLQLTIGGETLEKLRLAKDMLSHAVPSGDEAAVLDRALTSLLVELARKKFADTPTPRPSHGGSPDAREPKAAVQRAVWVRDLGRCKYIGPGGHRCNERRFLEFHHVIPYALGGKATIDNIELRCRRHNQYEGRLVFGTRRDGAGVVRETAVAYSALPTNHNLFRNEFQEDADRTARASDEL
jgi:HNH endonuclease